MAGMRPHFFGTLASAPTALLSQRLRPNAPHSQVKLSCYGIISLLKLIGVACSTDIVSALYSHFSSRSDFLKAAEQSFYAWEPFALDVRIRAFGVPFLLRYPFVILYPFTRQHEARTPSPAAPFHPSNTCNSLREVHRLLTRSLSFQIGRLPTLFLL